MTTKQELQARMNPTGLTLTDVMFGLPNRIQTGTLQLYRPRRGARTWTRRECWMIVAACVASWLMVTRLS